MTALATRMLDPCLVCGDKSIGFNFGVLSCMACKAFFRRNAVKLGTYDFRCPKDGDCPITHTFRRLCNCCRLAKCFRVGMQKDLILSESEKAARRRCANNPRTIKKKLPEKIKLELVQQSHISNIKSPQSLYLSLSDQNRLRNIFNIYESTCIRSKDTHYPYFPLIRHTNLFAYLNEYSASHKVMIDYFKCIPEFNNLSLSNRVCLIRNQFGMVNNINEAIIHPGITTNLVVSLSNVFGVDLGNRLLQSIERIRPFASDVLLLKLVLVVVALSSGNHRNRNDTDMDQICEDTLSIFAAQNVYVELLWKYIRSRSSNEIHAVKMFNQLIQFLLHLFNVHLLVDGYINNRINDINQMEPLMQSMWPKPNNDQINSS